MIATCSRCGNESDHDAFDGAVPDFAAEFSYLVCRVCGSIFNPHNATNYTTDELNEICGDVLASSGARLGCYIFGPGSLGRGEEFRYEYEKRNQLRDSLATLPLVSKLIAWAKFPEEDMPKAGRSPTGPLVRQEIRLIGRVKKQGICPVLFFLIYSPGTIPELDVALAYPQNSVVFIREVYRHSLVGQDRIVDLRTKGAKVHFYP
jgi:hypothetical protein